MCPGSFTPTTIYSPGAKVAMYESIGGHSCAPLDNVLCHAHGVMTLSQENVLVVVLFRCLCS